jgi:beta-glucosidase
MENTGDHGSSWVRPPYAITPLVGLKNHLGDSAEVLFDDATDLASAVRTASSADAVVVVAGYTHLHEGEYIPDSQFGAVGGDRSSLSLLDDDVTLIEAVSRANANTIVVIVGGSAVTTEEWRDRVPSILMAWYSGMEGGTALARILFGEVNPSGKLPCVFPQSEDQLPFFDKDADEITYDFYHGYNLLDRNNTKPAYTFGFGLSYTTFAYSNLRLDQIKIDALDEVKVTVDVTNTGEKAGDEVVQLYIGYHGSAVERHAKDLKGFRRVPLQPGQTETVVMSVRGSDIAYYNVDGRDWLVEPTSYVVYVGGSSRSEDLLQSEFTIVS